MELRMLVKWLTDQISKHVSYDHQLINSSIRSPAAYQRSFFDKKILSSLE